MLYVLYSIHAEKGNEILMIEDSRFRVQVAASPPFWLMVFSYRQPSLRGRCPEGADRALAA